MPSSLLRLLPLCTLLMLAGCPPREDTPPEGQGEASVPGEPLPVRGKLLDYGGLRLGMSSVEIAQVYNAPDGKGDGFQRVIQDFDGVQHHFIKFDTAEGEPLRKLVLALLRDELYMIVDRRDALSPAQAEAWRAELAEQYGAHDLMSIGDAQWRWGPENGVELIFTQDNAGETVLSAHVVLSFQPYADAAYGYLEDWQRAHPDYKAEELPF